MPQDKSTSGSKLRAGNSKTLQTFLLGLLREVSTDREMPPRIRIELHETVKRLRRNLNFPKRADIERRVHRNLSVVAELSPKTFNTILEAFLSSTDTENNNLVEALTKTLVRVAGTSPSSSRRPIGDRGFSRLGSNIYEITIRITRAALDKAQLEGDLNLFGAERTRFHAAVDELKTTISSRIERDKKEELLTKQFRNLSRLSPRIFDLMLAQILERREIGKFADQREGLAVVISRLAGDPTTKAPPPDKRKKK